jgi:hypothetical protein
MRTRQFEHDGHRQPAKIVDADDQRAKGRRAQQSAEPIETMTGERGPRQRVPRQRQAHDAEWHVYREQPLPGGDRQNPCSYTRPDRRRGRADQRVDPDASAELVGGVDETEQGGVDAHDAGATKTLEDARGDECDQRA